MDREQLMQILPHRDGMLLLDSAERQDDCARGRYTAWAYASSSVTALWWEKSMIISA